MIESTELTNQESGYPLMTSSRQGLFVQNEYFNREKQSSEDTLFSVVPRGYVTYRHMSDDDIFHFNINNLAVYGLVSREYPVFTTTPNLNSYLLVEILNSSFDFRKFCKQQKKGGTRTRLYFSVLGDYKITIPSIQEQQKIAAFLSLLDDRISKQRELIEKLKTYKRGALSAIFNRKIRFKDKDGNPFPDWQTVKFSELYAQVSEKNDGSFGTDKIISVANMYFKSDVTIGSEDYLKSYNICRLGDIAFEGNKSKNFAFGRLVENHIGDGIVSHVFIVFRPLNTNHNIDYWKIAINYEPIMGKILSKCTKKSTMMTDLVPRDFLQQTLAVPCPEEQRLIAVFLSKIDNYMNKQKEYLDKLTSLKSTLLQQMFI